MTTSPPNEVQELLGVSKLVLRGAAATVILGLIWHYPSGHLLVQITQGILVVVLGYVAVLSLGVAALGLRNWIGRRLQMRGHVMAIRLLGVALIVCLALLFAALFQMSAQAWA